MELGRTGFNIREIDESLRKTDPDEDGIVRLRVADALKPTSECDRFQLIPNLNFFLWPKSLDFGYSHYPFLFELKDKWFIDAEEELGLLGSWLECYIEGREPTTIKDWLESREMSCILFAARRKEDAEKIRYITVAINDALNESGNTYDMLPEMINMQGAMRVLSEMMDCYYTVTPNACTCFDFVSGKERPCAHQIRVYAYYNFSESYNIYEDRYPYSIKFENENDLFCEPSWSEDKEELDNIESEYFVKPTYCEKIEELLTLHSEDSENSELRDSDFIEYRCESAEDPEPAKYRCESAEDLELGDYDLLKYRCEEDVETLNCSNCGQRHVLICIRRRR